MADHQRHPGAARGRNDGVTLFHSRRDRLLDHDMDAARNALQSEVMMQMRRGRDRHRIDAGPEQIVDIAACGAA